MEGRWIGVMHKEKKRGNCMPRGLMGHERGWGMRLGRKDGLIGK